MPLRVLPPRPAKVSRRHSKLCQGHWRGSNLQRKATSNFARDFNIKSASAATAAEARGDGRLPPLCGLPAAAAAWSCGTGRTAERALTPQVLQRTPPGPSPINTASVVVVALALFREELRKHPYFLNTFSGATQAPCLLAEHLLWLVVVAFFLRGVTQAPLLPEHLLF